MCKTGSYDYNARCPHAKRILSIDCRLRRDTPRPAAQMPRRKTLAVPSTPAQRHARASRFALMVMFISYFGFVATDNTGFGNNSEDVVLNHLLRMSGQAVAAVIVFISALHNRIFFTPTKIMSLLTAMYLFYLASYVILIVYGSYTSSALTPLIRLAEYTFVIVVICQCLHSGLQNPQETAIGLIKFLIGATYVVCAVYVVMFPTTVISFGFERTQFGGAAISPNRLALLASVGIMTFGMFGRGRRDFGLFVLSIVVAFLTMSRTGYLLMSMALFITAFTRSIGGVKAGILLTGVLATAAAMSFVAFDPATQALLNSLATDEQFASLNGRLDIWGVGLQMGLESPLLGWGFIEGPKKIGSLLNQPWWNATNAQNDILGAIISGGAPGLAFLLLFYITVLISLGNAPRNRTKVYLSWLLLMFLASSQFEPFLIHLPVQPTIILLLALRLLDLSPHKFSVQHSARTWFSPTSAQSG